jgi:hypothetical protein
MLARSKGEAAARFLRSWQAHTCVVFLPSPSFQTLSNKEGGRATVHADKREVESAGWVQRMERW